MGLLIAGLRLVERVGKRSARGWGWARVKVTDIALDDSKAPSQVSKVTSADCWLKAYFDWVKSAEAGGDGE